MSPFLFMACCPQVYSDPCFSTLLPWRGNCSIFSDPSLLRCSHLMPCLFIASFRISTVLPSVLHLALASYWSWHMNVCCTMPPNVAHIRCHHCAYIGCILCIQLFFLCTIQQEIWVSAFFQNLLHADVPLTT